MATHVSITTGEKIITHHEYPPIPCRKFDWSAVTDNYEPGCPIGWGKTEREAMIDLFEQLDGDQS